MNTSSQTQKDKSDKIHKELGWWILNRFGESVDRGTLKLASRNRRELLAKEGVIEDLGWLELMGSEKLEPTREKEE
jgi:hypothetical protein